VAEPIKRWLQELRDALASERRLRKTRIIAEVGDHLSSSADEFERQGMPRQEAEAKAVAQLGSPRSFAEASVPRPGGTGSSTRPHGGRREWPQPCSDSEP
jgi:hypothetical protein